MKITFRDTLIHAGVAGEGGILVLLHGFLESSSIWDPFLLDLSRKWKVITPDLPGHGSSGCFSETHTMEAMAEMVRAILKSLGSTKIDILGHSMGGYVALAFLELYPEMVGHITLLNSTSLPDSPEKRSVRERSVDLVRKNKEAYIRLSVNGLFSPTNLEKFGQYGLILKERACGFPTEGITAALKGMKIRTNRTRVLEQFKGAKTIIAGKEDPLIPVEEIRHLAGRTGCRFHLLPGGHLSYVEAASEFLNLCISSKK